MLDINLGDLDIFKDKNAGDEDVSFFQMIIEILKALWEFLQDAFSGFSGESKE